MVGASQSAGSGRAGAGKVVTADSKLTSVVWTRLTPSVAPREPAPAKVPLASLDEQQLLSLCRAGNEEAFEVVVTRHQRAVYGLCYRFVGNHEDAADLAQEVFLRAYRALPSFRGTSSLGTWLYRIAVNVSLNRVSVRTPSTIPVEACGSVRAAGATPAEALLEAERASQVRAAVARLPKKQRATLILRVYHDLPHQEIAAILGTSVGAVKANFFHALSNLRRMLGSRDEARDGAPVEQ